MSAARARVGRLQHSAPLAYCTILLLQLHRIWNIWRYRDLTTGDTSFYFRMAWEWHAAHKVNLVWSPLYTLFYGTFPAISRDAYVVTTLHRVLIVMAAAMLVLAIMRRLLPPMLAWLMAAWWAILPINFNTAYEVHLFALLPVAIALLIALRKRPGPWTRGTVLALFVLTTLLVRNEYLIACVVFGLICLTIEARQERRLGRAGRTRRVARVAAIYTGLLVAAGGIVGGFLLISDTPISALPRALHEKHTLNMAQVYAFGYKQRHPEWKKSPWDACDELCQAQFGNPHPTLFEMLRANPRAVRDHVLWNISLFPSGWQVLLFNATAGKVNPDYEPTRTHMAWPLCVGLLMLAVVLAAARAWWKERSAWNPWFAERAGGWLALLAAISVGPAIVITQRPRPCYFFTVSILSMAMFGTAVMILLRTARTRDVERWVIGPLMLLGWVFVPSAFPPADRPAHDLYERLAAYSNVIDRPDCRFLVGQRPGIVRYIGLATALRYSGLLTEWKGQGSLNDFFLGDNLNLVYLDERAIEYIRQTSPDALSQFASSSGWVLLGSGRGPHAWFLFQRATFDNSAGKIIVPSR